MPLIMMPSKHLSFQLNLVSSGYTAPTFWIEKAFCLSHSRKSCDYIMHFAEPAIWPSSIRTEDLTCANHVHVLTVWSVFPSNVHINILRGLPCRLESLRLKIKDGDLDKSIKRSASDRLGDLVPQVRARTSPGVFHFMALLGLCLELSLVYSTVVPRPTLLLSCISLSQRSGQVLQVLSGLRTWLVRITLTCSQSDRCFLRMSISTSSVVSRVDWKACA